MSTTADQKRQRIETAVKIIGLLAISWMVAPIILMTIKGLIGLIVAGIIGFIGIKLLPWFSAKVSNLALKLLLKEAADNPIETLKNQYIERQKGLVSYQEQLGVLYSEVQNYKDMVTKYKREHPDDTDNIGDYMERLQKMFDLYESRKNKLQDAKANLEEFAKIIKRKTSEWDMAQATLRMNKIAGAHEEAVNKFMTDAALESVQRNLNMAISGLEMEFLDEPVKKSLPSSQSTSIALDPVREAKRVN